MFAKNCIYLVFRRSIVMCLGMDFFEFIYLWFAQLLVPVDLCSSPNLERFSPLFLWILLHLHLSHSPYRIPMIPLLDLLFFSWDYLLFKDLFTLCSDWMNYIALFSKSSNLSAAIPALIIRPLCKFFLISITFFSFISTLLCFF